MTTKTCADIHRELFPTYDALLEECCAKEKALIAATDDIRLAAGELMILMPKPGTDMSRMMLANVAMRRERDAARQELRKDDPLYQRAIDVFGREPQLRMVQEECAELVAAINRRLRGRLSDVFVAEEIADVLIVAAQARLIYGAQLVDQLVAEKLERLEDRVAEAEERAV